MSLMPEQPFQIAIVGGGAAGFFCAITAARLAQEKNLSCRVTILESSNQFLKKVKISGGGRCNVTHKLFDVSEFCQNYPRGRRELLSPMQKFQAQDTVKWFQKAGIRLIAEDDGRMFPDTHSSQTIIDCYLDQANQFGVDLKLRSPVKSIQASDSNRLILKIKDQESFHADLVLIATGSSPAGYRLAESLGHSITERAPSLFSFKIDDPLLQDLPGLSFPFASLKLSLPKKKSFQQSGPILITHWGLSGPAILKLSAWSAREMKQVNHQAQLSVSWLGDQSSQQLTEKLKDLKNQNPKNLMKNIYPAELPKRFWLKVLAKGQIDIEKQWANLSHKELNLIINILTQSDFQVLGQNRYKDEFVECGGVHLKEVDFKTMESKICPNLYFAGELLDVDGITGGFNFQNAWTTGWIAAHSMVERLTEYKIHTPPDN